MAKREEEVILKLDVDQGGAEKELERVEKSILDTRKAMSDLNKSYKDGKTSQDEYVKESVKLQKSMKQDQDLKRQTIKLLDTESNSRNAMRAKVAKLTKEYNNLNLSTKEGQKRSAELEKQLKKLNDEINEGSKRAGNFKDNIGRYTESIIEASKSINIHGVSVGNLIGTLKSFVNPATAVIAVISGLTAAYASSSVGARDYANATNQIGAAFEQAQNNYGKFIQSQTGGGSGSNGPLSRLAYSINQALFGTGAANQASAIAAAKERIIVLERAQVVAAGEAKEAERLAEIQRRIRDDEKNSFEERLKAIKTINNELTRSAALRTTVNNVLKDAIRYASVDFEFDYVAQNRIVELNRANLDIAEEIEGKKTENLMFEKTLLDLQNTLDQNRRRTARDQQFFKNGPQDEVAPEDKQYGIKRTTDGYGTTKDVIDSNAKVVDSERMKQDAMKETARLSGEINTKIASDQKKLADIQQAFNKQRMAALEYTTEQAAQLFSDGSVAYKVFASAQALISTLLSSQKAFESLVGIPIVGPTLAASAKILAYANGIKTVAQINNVKFAAGGYTGSGFGSPDSSGFKPAGIVHEHEYVAPKRVTMSASAQPHIQALESMRLRGYADGGLVANTSTGSASAAMASANAIQNMPAPILDVSETMKVMKTIDQRERAVRLNNKR
jgi:hypothetical protein